MQVSADEWKQAGARWLTGVPRAPALLPASLFERDPAPAATTTLAVVPDLEEPISPELILVSPPEVARRARERLPDPAPPPPRRERARNVGQAVVARAPTTYMPPLVAPAATPTRDALTDTPVGGAAVPGAPDARLPAHLPGRGVQRATVAVGLISVLALAISVLDGVHELRGSSSGTRPVAQAAAPAVSPVRTAIAPNEQTKTSSSATINTTSTHSAVPSIPVRVKPKTPRFVPARVFAWPPVTGAGSYLIGFYREGKKVFETHSRARSIRLGSSFKFLPGQYRWQVFPVFGAGANERLGKAIVDSTFAVSAQPQR